MKITRLPIVLAALLGAVGCAPLQPLLVADAVGPLQPLLTESGPHGSMIVYTDAVGAVADPGDFSPHSDYRLFSSSGALLQTVENRSTSDARRPRTVRLGVGSYLVTASAPRVGLVSIPIVIGENQTTVIDLVREVMPDLQAAGDEWVRLPNGQVIGAKAQQL